MVRVVNAAGLALIQRWEGYHRALPDGSCAVYLCPAGVPTVGWGSTRGPDGAALTAADGPFSRAECEALFARDVARFAAGVRGLLRADVSDNQFAALVSFAYNLGVGALRSSTLLRRVNAGDVGGAAAQFGRWVNAGGRRLPGLVARREAERALFLTPDLRPRAAPIVVPAAARNTAIGRFMAAFERARAAAG